MVGHEIGHDAVEEAPPFRGAVGEEAIHLRREPKEMDEIGQRGLALGCRAIDTHHAPVGLVGQALDLAA